MANSSEPLVSILMPFFNPGVDFAAALRSILEQTYGNWELLLCDDGSTDGSLELARGIRDERVRVWSDGARKGLAGRLNDCIDRAQGQFMARMDADDVSYPGRLRRQVDFLLQHPEIDLLGCNMLIFGEDGEALGQRRLPAAHSDIVAHPSLGFGVAHPTWMARARWFQQYRYDVTALRYEDVELLYRSYPNSRFANLPELLYGYREMRGGFQKRFKTRLGRVRYLHARRDRLQPFTACRAALAEGIRIVADAILVAVSARYAMLRLREQRLSSSELAVWQQVFAAAQPERARA